MARFRGHVGNTTRLGHDSLSASAYGWTIGGSVYVWGKDDIEAPKGPRGGWRKGREVDAVTLSLQGGTNNRKVPMVTVTADTEGHLEVWVNGTLCAFDLDGEIHFGRVLREEAVNL